MKINTIRTTVGIIAVVCIVSTLSIGILSQQAYSKACNIRFGNGTIIKQTGSACGSEPDKGAINIHFK
jgi:hypothetical protein